MTRRRKVPMRICLGCQEKKPKKSLVRLVRTPEGQVEIDPTGKKSGRGAYVCPQENCLIQAQKGKRLEKNLKHKIPDDLVEHLWATIKEEQQP